ncbi:serine aminopeptidase, s33 domain-containing protein [Ditylenchus destructor]|uniref:Serine aminopeptidase, s33 domain-containing protein n=1 Tax=Ditylenchus destructor TaxID=166010 RepID=A0AAD4MVR7_9BILA|nr:serine aminopeptidase, s33 domain-containing protein [Ditylenchus destructor]
MGWRTASTAYFSDTVQVPFRDYNDLSKYGVRSRGRNFYLNGDSAKSQDLPKLGVWHILPESLSQQFQSATDEDIENSLNEGDHSIVVYLHGTACDRAIKGRCKLYNVLSKMGFHVLALDYRGYGDSTGCPNENGLIQDAHAIYNYARQVAPSKDIFIWGHSMGSGVTARTAAELSDAGTPPTAIVLEAPFNNIPDVVRGHPVGRAIAWLPFGKSIVDNWVIGSMTAAGLELTSDRHIERVTCPILVLHAQDDPEVSVELARKLVAKAEAAQRRVTFVEFEARHKLRHDYIHKAEDLPEIVR